ncbi:MAG: hypothetical protein ROO71_09805 [Balneola sp.]
MERCYKIFGKVIKLNTIKSTEGDILHKELSLYPETNVSGFDISINYVADIKTEKVLSNNPGLNYLSSESILCKMGAAKVKFCFQEERLKQIDFSIDHKSGLKASVEKWKSIQYTSGIEAIGQIFHELVLVPMAFLLEDTSVVHSSGIVNKQDEVVLFGGTGGVGKTSLEMTLCLEHEYKFFNDDIAIIDSKGMCHPNFSYPKIYGYNLLGAPELKREIFDGLSQMNKFHYAYRALKGASKVRRRVEPGAFYGKVYDDSAKISSIVILFRSSVEEIELESIPVKKAAKSNSLIMATEYNVFFDQVRWHEFNASALNRKPFTTYKSLIERNTSNLEKGLQDIDKVYLAHIPMQISNDDFKLKMVAKLKKEGII